MRHTNRSKLREVDFRFENQMLRGLEQNPSTGSRWAELARAGKKVMQFLDSGRYVANVVDGVVNFYGRKQRPGYAVAKVVQKAACTSETPEPT